MRALDTVDDDLFIARLSLHLRLGLATLATLLTRALPPLLATGNLGLLRRRLGLLARSRLAHAAGRSSSVAASARDLRALERVPASAQGAGVFVAEVEGDFVDVELEMGLIVSFAC